MSDTQKKLGMWAVVVLAGALAFVAGGADSIERTLGGWAVFVGLVGLLVTFQFAPKRQAD